MHHRSRSHQERLVGVRVVGDGGGGGSGGSDVELDAHLCRYRSVGAPDWGGRTPGSQTPGVPATLGLNVQMDGG